MSNSFRDWYESAGQHMDPCPTLLLAEAAWIDGRLGAPGNAALMTCLRDVLDSCKTLLSVYESAGDTGRATWAGRDIDRMREAVTAAEKLLNST